MVDLHYDSAQVLTLRETDTACSDESSLWVNEARHAAASARIFARIIVSGQTAAAFQTQNRGNSSYLYW